MVTEFHRRLGTGSHTIENTLVTSDLSSHARSKSRRLRQIVERIWGRSLTASEMAREEFVFGVDNAELDTENGSD
jgi:hypothetical protein